MRALETGLGIDKPGYNIFVSGSSSTGKKGIILHLLEKFAKKRPRPCDWVYVYDFANKDTPRSIALRAGGGVKFAKAMDELIANLESGIRSALQSEDFENTVNEIVSKSNDKQGKKFSELERIAAKMNFQIKSTSIGMETIPIVKGQVLSEKGYTKLSQRERDKIEKSRSLLEPIVLKYARKIRDLEAEMKLSLHNLEKVIASRVVDVYMDPLFDTYRGESAIVDHLGKVRDFILDNLNDFTPSDDDSSEHEHPGPSIERDRYLKYRVNVLVDNTSKTSAPVVFEPNPSYYNLFGKLERSIEHGVYLTDFTKIKAGSLHKANSGYLVLDAADLLKTPYVWETLKRILKNRKAYIEELDEHFALMPASALRPHPIPLEVKVIVIGDEDLYRYLLAIDEEFTKIYKVKVDFDYAMDRTRENVRSYANFVATRCHKENLHHFDAGGVAALVEFGSRLVEHQSKLTTDFGEIKDLVIESEFIAREHGHSLVRRSHVEQALDEQYRRINLYERRLQEMVRTRDLMISLEGQRIGQVNALTVADLGDYSFGRVCRITCTASLGGDGGIHNIERSSKLSGSLHDKGVYILSSFISALLARNRELPVSASLAFEQSYSEVDGDSATVGELIALVSAISSVPVHQSTAVTGSLNQLGDVQPVGGVNEKIEGFYKTCKSRLSKARSYQVIIPQQNIANLMLNKVTRSAVTSGELKIYPVRHFWQAFELATNVSFGAKSVQSRGFSPESALARIEKKLALAATRVDSAQRSD